jgi:hypothetical protein
MDRATGGAATGMKTWIAILGVAVLGACDPSTKDVGDIEPAAVCESDEPIGGGAYLCDESQHEHQREDAACEVQELPPCTMPDEFARCSSDAQCGEGELCVQSDPMADDAPPSCDCLPSPCAAADDCTASTTCYCGMNARGECVDAGCQIDADCGSYLCAASKDACGVHGLHCTTPDDLCDPATAWPCTFIPETGRWENSGAIGCP